jgi:hypothetical protein
MNNKSLSVDTVIDAINANPEGFLKPEFDKTRSSKKSANRYLDNKILLANGKITKLGLSWKMQPLTGGIKEPDERKFDPTIQFRQSSGALGESAVKIYDTFNRLVTEGLAAKTIQVKKDKQLIRTIVQKELETGEELDDPIIRFKLPFTNGKPDFKLYRIDERDGKPVPTRVQNVTLENIHTIIRSGYITSGYVSLDTICFSGFGISMPAKVQLLVIKPVNRDGPDLEDLLDADDMAEMMAPADDGDAQPGPVPANEEGVNADGVGAEDAEAAPDPNADATEEQLEALRTLAIDEE